MTNGRADERLDDFRGEVNRRFEDVGHRFDEVDRKFGEVKEDMNRRFGEVNSRLDRIDDRLDWMGKAIVFSNLTLSGSMIVGFIAVAFAV